MAIYRSTIFSYLSNKLADTILYKRRSKGIIRSYVAKVTDARTAEQLTQRAKMKLLVGLSRRLAPVIAVGFLPFKHKQSVYNAFVQANMPLVIVDENFSATLPMEKMICADGDLKKPEVTASLQADSRMVSLAKTAQQIIGLCAKDDKVYAGFYETEQNEAALVEIGERGNASNVDFELPKDWQAANLRIYAFAISRSKRDSSPTVYVELS